ncbi:hypothetical protein AB0R99_00120 [Erwinia amylovora]|uniref:hypothetical protein n=1 Tax=Erwinia amylovora TaxID=552 RepID=UPI0037DDCB10
MNKLSYLINAFRISKEHGNKLDKIIESKTKQLKNSKDPLDKNKTISKTKLAKELLEYGIDKYLKEVK